MSQAFQVGQQVVWHNPRGRTTPAIVTFVGRKWVTIDEAPRDRFDRTTGRGTSNRGCGSWIEPHESHTVRQKGEVLRAKIAARLAQIPFSPAPEVVPLLERVLAAFEADTRVQVLDTELATTILTSIPPAARVL